MSCHDPLFVQRQQCAIIAKASCIKLNTLISEPHKKVWRSNFNPHVANLKIKKQLILVEEMIVSLDKKDYFNFLALIEDSYLNGVSILGLKTVLYYRQVSKVNLLKKDSEDVRQRLQIIYCVLYAYVYGLN